jgi:hypothetical protein
MDAPIKVIKNFIDDYQIKDFIDFIDLLERDNFESFSVYQEGKRLALAFGRDNYHEHNSHKNLSLLVEKQKEVDALISRVTETTKELYKVDENLYACSLWLAKQYPGATVPKHEDTDDGHNTHFVYSAVLYLNELESGGELTFIDLNYSYKPSAGDLVVFPSIGTGFHTVLEIPEVRYSIPLWMTLDESMELSGRPY